MQAKINGVTVTGTPEEIAEYQKIMDDMRRNGVNIKPPLGNPPEWVKPTIPTGGEWWMKPTITCITTKGPANCFAAQNGGCNCSGACQT